MPGCTGSTLHNDGMTEPSKSLSSTAFVTLLLIAFMMGANHVAARFAFNDGVDGGLLVFSAISDGTKS